MMLCKLSFSNIKKSFKDYAIYFTTLILGVCIFYVFNSLDSQTAMLEVSKNTSQIIDILLSLLSGTSIFVSGILGFLIIYASRFLIKKRNKEFGIYMLLGMTKRRISLLILLETIIIGVISLGVGLLVGVLISQVTSVFIANLFEADMTKYTFNFSASAMIKTIIYFSIIYIIVMIFNTVMVNKCRLIDLLQASKKSEQIKLKNPIICIFLFLISIVILSIAYYMVTGGLDKLIGYNLGILLIPICLGCLGTFLFFYSVSGLLIKIFNKLRNVKYKELNIFVFKQLSSKINTMVASISIICIMLFITICLLASGLSIKNYFDRSLKTLVPADFQIIFEKGDNDSLISNDLIVGLINNYEKLKNNISEMEIIGVYRDDNFNYKASLGNIYESLYNMYPHLLYSRPVSIMSLSDYNKIAKLFKLEKINLDKDEYAIVSNYREEIYNDVLSNDNIMNIFGHELKPYDSKVIYGFTQMSGNPSNIGFFVVDDSIIDSDYHYKFVIGNYKLNDKRISREMLDIYDEIITNQNIIVNTKVDIIDACVGISAIATFIGLYLGIIFLISSAAILALKELSDCIDDKPKYTILRNIGADEKLINKSLFKQILIFFSFPLLLAVVHTIFGIKFSLTILSSVGVVGVLKPIIITSAFIVLIYGGYLIITYYCCKNIIRNRG